MPIVALKQTNRNGFCALNAEKDKSDLISTKKQISSKIMKRPQPKMVDLNDNVKNTFQGKIRSTNLAFNNKIVMKPHSEVVALDDNDEDDDEEMEDIPVRKASTNLAKNRMAKKHQPDVIDVDEDDEDSEVEIISVDSASDVVVITLDDGEEDDGEEDDDVEASSEELELEEEELSPLKKPRKKSSSSMPRFVEGLTTKKAAVSRKAASLVKPTASGENRGAKKSKAFACEYEECIYKVRILICNFM
jgi:hypothetical protein